MRAVDRGAAWYGWREAVAALSALAAVAVVVLGANPLREETVAPMDLLQAEPGWHELALDLPSASPHRSDVLDGLLPRWLFLKRALRAGALPSWNPDAGLGEPGWQLLFNGYLTPRFAMFVLFGDALGFYLGLLVQLLGAGLGSYLLARRVVTVMPALCASVTFMLCGFNVSWMMWPHTATSAMVPWAVWAVWRVLEGASPPASVAGPGAREGAAPGAAPHGDCTPRALRRRGVALAICTALLVFGGFPAVVVYAGYLCLALLLARLTGPRAAVPWVVRARVAVVAAVGGGLGLLLAAVQLLPSLEFLRFFDLSHRGPVGAGIDPRELLLAPLPGGLPPDPETCGYVGVTAVLLALVGAAPMAASSGRRLRFAARFWSATLIGSLVLVLRFPRPAADLLYRLPGLSFNPNNRALVVFGLAAAMLAGVGLERLISRLRRHIRQPVVALMAVVVVGLGASLAQVVDLGRVSRAQNAVVPASSFLPATSLTRWLGTTLEPGQGVVAEGFLTGGTLSGYGLREPFSHGFVSAAERQLLGHLAADAWLTPKAARPSLRSLELGAAPWFDLLSVRFVVAPCAIVRARFEPRAAAGMAADRPLSLAEGRELRRPVVMAEPTEIEGIALLVSQAEPDETRVSAALASADGRRPVLVSGVVAGRGVVAWAELELTTPQQLAAGRYTLEVSAPQGGVAVWGTAAGPAYYLLQPLEVPGDLAASWRLAHSSHGMCALANPDAPHGAMLVQPGVDPPLPDSPAPGAVAVLASGDDCARYRVCADGPRLLVRSTRDYPGWQVTVDGQVQPVATAYGALQAVAVPAGESLVGWSFRPASVTVGLVISLLALIAAGLAWWRP